MISPQDKAALISVLEDTRALLALPDNDFVWTRWNNGAEAVQEIDDFISKIKNDRGFDAKKLQALFVPTGSIQEVAFGGWMEEYMKVATRFDKAIVPFKNVRPVRKPAGPNKRFGM